VSFEVVVAPVTGSEPRVLHVGYLALARVVAHEKKEDHLEHEVVLGVIDMARKVTDVEARVLAVQ
jgi:hypothetical protein